MRLDKGKYAKRLPRGFDRCISMSIHTNGYMVQVCHVSPKTIYSLMSDGDVVGLPTYYAIDGNNILFYPAANKRYSIDFLYYEIKRA